VTAAGGSEVAGGGGRGGGRGGTVLLATANRHKLTELRRLLAAEGVTGLAVAGLPDLPGYREPVEDGATFEDNALIKARAAAAASGLPALADDSGLCVDALNGMPGVLSARWSGRHGDDDANLRLVLAQVADVPDSRRGARFDCAAALVLPSGDQHVLRTSWRGTLARVARGGNGFGYDPIFVPSGETRTSAELDPDEKDAQSHRGQAMRAILPRLRVLAR
jgi:XTP/dITP diphosphohydrolase